MNTCIRYTDVQRKEGQIAELIGHAQSAGRRHKNPCVAMQFPFFNAQAVLRTSTLRCAHPPCRHTHTKLIDDAHCDELCHKNHAIGSQICSKSLETPRCNAVSSSMPKRYLHTSIPRCTHPPCRHGNLQQK